MHFPRPEIWLCTVCYASILRRNFPKGWVPGSGFMYLCLHGVNFFWRGQLELYIPFTGSCQNNIIAFGLYPLPPTKKIRPEASREISCENTNKRTPSSRPVRPVLFRRSVEFIVILDLIYFHCCFKKREWCFKYVN